MRMINNKSLLECMRFVTEKISVDFDGIIDEVISEINAIPNENDNSVDYVSRLIRETEDKKLRMLDSYFAEVISSEEMEGLKKKYDKQLDNLHCQLADAENRLSAIADRQRSLADLKDIIKNQTIYSESVYGEILDKITVYDDYMLIKPKYLDFAFKIKYSTHGYKEKYTTAIEECTIVSVEE